VIVGGLTGILFTDEDATIVNHGAIAGLDGAGMEIFAASGSSITNTGEITGGLYGIAIANPSTGAAQVINNSGIVSGADNAVYLDTATFTTIINSGTMTAGDSFANAVQQLGTGQVYITNTGSLHRVALGVGSDSITNNGEMSVVTLGDGADGYNGRGSLLGALILGEAGEDSLLGGAFDDEFDGGTENDTLVGGDGDDYVDGGSGKDLISGGRGADQLIGGSQKDTFVFRPHFGNDVIFDFAPGGGGHDVIQFRRDVFTDYADVSAAMTQVGTDVLITADNGDTILILNVIVSSLVAADFTFG
jgi:Ca2+-binding RTX toxin-like protein